VGEALTVIIPTMDGIVSVSSLGQISEVVLSKGSGLSSTVSQIPPQLPPFLFSVFLLHFPLFQFMYFITIITTF
jgi:hypothetical protein